MVKENAVVDGFAVVEVGEGDEELHVVEVFVGGVGFGEDCGEVRDDGRLVGVEDIGEEAAGEVGELWVWVQGLGASFQEELRVMR